MRKEYRTINVLILIVVAFIAGAVVGYYVYDLINTEDKYQFNTGDNILLNSGFENELGDNPAFWFKAIIPADGLVLNWMMK